MTSIDSGASICYDEQHMKRDSSQEKKFFSTMQVSIEYVLDTTEVVQRDDVPWERYVAQVAFLEDQSNVDDW